MCGNRWRYSWWFHGEVPEETLGGRISDKAKTAQNDVSCKKSCRMMVFRFHSEPLESTPGNVAYTKYTDLCSQRTAIQVQYEFCVKKISSATQVETSWHTDVIPHCNVVIALGSLPGILLEVVSKISIEFSLRIPTGVPPKISAGMSLRFFFRNSNGNFTSNSTEKPSRSS